MLVSKTASYNKVYNNITWYLGSKRSVSIWKAFYQNGNYASECCDDEGILFLLCGIFYLLPFKIMNMYYLIQCLLKILLKKELYSTFYCPGNSLEKAMKRNSNNRQGSYLQATEIVSCWFKQNEFIRRVSLGAWKNHSEEHWFTEDTEGAKHVMWVPLTTTAIWAPSHLPLECHHPSPIIRSSLLINCPGRGRGGCCQWLSLGHICYV